MHGRETILFYLTAGMGLILSMLLLFFKDRVRSFSIPAAVAMLFMEGVFIGIRWVSTGHPPIFGTFESTLSASWALILFSVLMDRKGRYAQWVIPFATLTLLYGLLFDTTGKPLVISEQSYWVYFHALFAWIAYGFYTFSCAGALALLGYAQTNSDDAGDVYPFTYTALLNGFLAQTIMFAIGSYYSIRLHGSWWTWDPVEYLFVVSWCLYAIPIHGRILFGWEQRRISRFILLGMAGTMLLYWGLIYFPWSTYHIFDVEFKIHF